MLRGIRINSSNDVSEVGAAVLRGGIRVTNTGDTPDVVTTIGRQEAWDIYLKTAPDIVFIDLHLADGSGHALAQAIKEIDAKSYVIVVTANNYTEEIDVANQNNVDAFIAKPYNKKTILDCIEKYITTFRSLKGYLQR